MNNYKLETFNQLGIQFRECNNSQGFYVSTNADYTCYLEFVPRILDEDCFLVASVDSPEGTEEYFEDSEKGIIDAIKWLEAGVTFNIKMPESEIIY
jgi:hypothetical protein